MIRHGDALEILKEFEKDSISSLVTDPPAGISFMGKDWDSNKGGRDQWIAWLTDVMRECYRVMKPGAHGLVWAIPRTSHWTATALENAGFEVRDVITHLFGTGFPKSLDISKAIDKAAGAEREVVGWDNNARISVSSDARNLAQGKRDKDYGAITGCAITAPATEAAKQWAGWGTALKPASEHWILIRKPIAEKTVAANVLKYGVGGLNIDACRIGTEEVKEATSEGGKFAMWNADGTNKGFVRHNGNGTAHSQGRFPANLVLDEVAAEMLGNACRFFYVAKASKSDRNAGLEGMPEREKGAVAGAKVGNTLKGPTNALRPDKPTLSANFHPTVKSTKLMEYLIKLITPPGGVVLDPFMGSGSTGVAAKRLGHEFIGIELDEEYIEIAKRRIG